MKQNYQPTKAQIKKWVKALRSGKYKQDIGRLQTNQGYCCLGVACKIFIPQNKLTKKDALLVGANPRDQKNAPDWLKIINTTFHDLVKRDESGISYNLIHLNDTHQLSFNEIADILEAVYIYEVLN